MANPTRDSMLSWLQNYPGSGGNPASLRFARMLQSGGGVGGGGIGGQSPSGGPQGAAGTDGATGAQGPTGLTGTAGTDGADGATGAQGPTGLTGTAGTDGAEYTLEGYAKYTGVFHGNACVKMDFRDKERNSVGGKHPISCFLTPDDPEDTWKYGKITAKVPAGKEHQDVRYVVVSAGMHIDGDRKGVVYFDDLILRKTCGILVRQNE